jgi:hypothetical protein
VLTQSTELVVRDATVFDPLIGWFARRDGGIGRYTVWHEPLAPIACHVEAASFQVFEDLGLVAPDTTPHSAFVAAAIHFDVHTPPVQVD